MIYRATSHDFVREQPVFPVEKQHAELLARLVLDLAADVFDESRSGENGPARFDLLARSAGVQLRDGLYLCGDGLAKAVDLHECVCGRGEDGGQILELRLQRPGDGLHVAARDERHQQRLEDFTIVQRVGAACEQFSAQPLKVALLVVLVRLVCHVRSAALRRRLSSFTTSARS